MIGRDNDEGISRDQLSWALTQHRIVRQARSIDRCLICRNAGVNEAGVCDSCLPLLNDRETDLVEQWVRGGAP